VRVLVTGAAGFVGSHLVPALAARGATPLATDRDELDTTDAEALDARLAHERPDAVVHLAAVSSVVAAAREPALAFRVNFLGAQALLAAVARRAPRARVLLVGSGECYGALPEGAPPADERTPLRPRSSYAHTKAAADLLGAAWAARGLDVVRVRAFSHTGPGQPDAFVLSGFARQLVEIEKGLSEPILRAGNLDSIRDFLDVRDVVEAYAALLDPRAPAAAYNVASGVGLRVGQLLERLMQRIGVRAEVRVEAARWRPADRSIGDARRLRAATGWAPRIALEQTLASLADDWRRRLSAS
jgi:GDP-4-dehydro-6-deoxy-D-mannose reductase